MRKRQTHKREHIANFRLLPRRSESWWTLRVALVGVCIVPLLISPSGADSFRLPKAIGLEATAIILLATMLIGAIWSGNSILRSFRIQRPADGLIAAILGWILLTAALSTNRSISMMTVAWVVSAMILFLALEHSARGAPFLTIVWGMIPALVNAILAMLQEFGIWNPFFSRDILYGPHRVRLSSHWATVGLLGNSNDVGTYLVPAVACAIAAALASRRWRFLWLTVAVILLAGVLVSQSLASVIALVAMIASFVLLLPRRWAIGLAAGFIVAGIMAATIPSPITARIESMRQFAREGRYDRLLSGRMISAASAWMMFKDRPFFGVGPGAYGFQYFDYRLKSMTRYPTIFRSGVEPGNFGEAHNDHLQVLATVGLPGFILLLGAMFYLGSRTFCASRAEDERARFARFAAFPLTVAFAVSALGQFPLELAAALSAYIFFASLCIAWSSEELT